MAINLHTLYYHFLYPKSIASMLFLLIAGLSFGQNDQYQKADPVAKIEVDTSKSHRAFVVNRNAADTSIFITGDKGIQPFQATKKSIRNQYFDTPSEDHDRYEVSASVKEKVALRNNISRTALRNDTEVAVKSFVAHDLPRFQSKMADKFAGTDRNEHTSQINNRAVGAIIYVDSSNVSGIHDGTTWNTAFSTLQDGLAAASEGDSIFVAAGAYYPATGQSFSMLENVKILGGFPMGGSTLAGRDWLENFTFLIGQGTHVIFNDHNNLTSSAVLDGFIVAGGTTDTLGGGILNYYSSPTITHCYFYLNTAQRGGGIANDYSSPYISDCYFIENYGSVLGGGISNRYHGSPEITNCLFQENSADAAGGGLSSIRGSSSVVSGCYFLGNTSDIGGGLYFQDSLPKLDTCLFENNESRDGGGAAFLLCPTIISNSTFLTNNSDERGGGIYIQDCNPLIYNCSFQGNNSDEIGGAMMILNSSPTIDSTIFYQNTAMSNGGALYSAASTPSIINKSFFALNESNSAGGLLLYQSNAVINDCFFQQNYSVGYGGAILSIESSPVITTSVFFYNVAQTGGGMYVQDGTIELNSSSLINNIAIAGGGVSAVQQVVTMNGCDFQENAAVEGGGGLLVQDSYSQLDNCLFSADSCINNGGGIYAVNGTLNVSNSNFNENYSQTDGGAVHIKSTGITLNNVTFNSNSCENFGGGVYSYTSNGTYNQCTWNDNSAVVAGGGILLLGGDNVNIDSCLFNGNISDNGGGFASVYSIHTILNSTFNQNSAIGGPGLYTQESISNVKKCTFNENEGDFGSGLCNIESISIVDSCIFKFNNSSEGGGLYNQNTTNSQVKNSTFFGNYAIYGGGYCNSGSIEKVVNCLFYNNSAEYGGALEAFGTAASTEIINCTISGNSADYGGGIYDNKASSVIKNSIVYGNSSGIVDSLNNYQITYSLVQSHSGGTGNIDGDTDPQFVDTLNKNYYLTLCSPVVNRGYNIDIAGYDIDIEGNDRIYNGGAVDMGAFELQEDQPSYSTLYVDGTNGNNSHNGSSWANAFKTLNQALTLAKSGGCYLDGNTIYVSAGTYQPDPSKSFVMKEGVEIYGGFPAGGGNPEDRDWTNNETILQGNGNRVFNNSGQNLTSASVLDGFTITGGTASVGGGMYNNNSSPTISNCTFVGNVVSEDGGAIRNLSHASPTIINCKFLDNEAAFGGGIVNDLYCSPTIINSVFSGNYATYYGGAMYNYAFSSPTITSCLLSGNAAYQEGGAIYNYGQSSPMITNSTIAGNEASGSSGSIFNNSNSKPPIKNCIIYGNSSGIQFSGAAPLVTYSLVQDLSGSTSNIDGSVDPLFIHLPAPGRSTSGDYRLQPCSPVINAGDTDGSGLPATDLDGTDRIKLGFVDMGAFESDIQEESSLAMADASITQFQSSYDGTIYGDCYALVATVTGDGTPTSIDGATTASVWIEETDPADFVRRHYEITPDDNAENATGRITLYFTQEDFDAFNLANPSAQPLPSESNDFTTEYIIIEKRSGVSSDGSGSPSSYPGSPENIVPYQENIYWNEDELRWEIKFDVTGFSGFFLKTKSEPLPLSLLKFNAAESDCRATISWRTAHEVAVSHFEVEVSEDGRQFVNAHQKASREVPTQIKAKNTKEINNYSVDMDLKTDLLYVRLKITDEDGSFAYSQVIPIKSSCAQENINIYPNPVNETLILSSSGKGTAQVYTSMGQPVAIFQVEAGLTYINMEKYPAGSYFLHLNGQVKRFTKVSE